MKTIQLTQGKVAIVDDEDFERVNKWRWHTQKSRSSTYAVRGIMRNGRQGLERLHRYLLNAPDGREVDHRDGDGLNNTRGNLRLCNHRQNHQNRKPRRGATSKFKGVSWHKKNGKWRACIDVRGKQISLGCFFEEEEAAHAYNEAAIKYFGEFARLNDIGA